MREIRSEYERGRKTTVGILGAAAGVGTTFASVAIASYLAEKKGRRTALLEVSTNHEIGSIMPQEQAFSIGRTVYYPDVALEDIPVRCNGEQECYVLDLGCEYTRVRLDFLRCDKKIVIGSTSMWKKASYYKLMDQISEEENYKQWLHCLILFGDKRDKREFSGRYHTAAIEMPYMESPFRISKKEEAFIERLSLV